MSSIVAFVRLTVQFSCSVQVGVLLVQFFNDVHIKWECWFECSRHSWTVFEVPVTSDWSMDWFRDLIGLDVRTSVVIYVSVFS